MSQHLCNILVHCIFHKGAQAPDIREQDQAMVNKYVAGICEQKLSHCLVVNGPGNHLHILISLAPTIALSELIKEIKRVSTLFLKEQDGVYYHQFYWQSGYGAFSVSYKVKDAVCQYILNQTEHHRKVSLEDELTALARNAKVDGYQREYYWER